jgi:hypothetical protein
MRPDRLDHHADEHVSRLILAAVADQTQSDGGIHTAAHGLAVEPDQPFRRSETSPANHSRSTLRTSNTRTSLNAIAASRPADRTVATGPSAGPTVVDPEWSITGAGMG